MILRIVSSSIALKTEKSKEVKRQETSKSWGRVMLLRRYSKPSIRLDRSRVLCLVKIAMSLWPPNCAKLATALGPSAPAPLALRSEECLGERSQRTDSQQGLFAHRRLSIDRAECKALRIFLPTSWPPFERPFFSTVLFCLSGLQQSRRLVGARCPRLRNGGWISPLLCRSTHPDLWEDRLRQGEEGEESWKLCCLHFPRRLAEKWSEALPPTSSAELSNRAALRASGLVIPERGFPGRESHAASRAAITASAAIDRGHSAQFEPSLTTGDNAK